MGLQKLLLLVLGPLALVQMLLLLLMLLLPLLTAAMYVWRV